MMSRYWAKTPEKRRAKLMPWFWNVFMKQGAIIGDRHSPAGVASRVKNKHRFSYPGYAEILTGVARDDVINSNEQGVIQFPTVLEFLKTSLHLEKNQVASFCSWLNLSRIVESVPGTIVNNAGKCIYPAEPNDQLIQQLNYLQFHTHLPFPYLRHDVFTFQLALHHYKKHSPKFLYLALGETDDWAHECRYDLSMDALSRADDYIRQLWEHVQSNPQRAARTTWIITTDHGRGDTLSDWSDHEAHVEGAQNVWIAYSGPSCNTRGVLQKASSTAPSIYHSDQIAATICKSLGIDFKSYDPHMGEPIDLFFS